jgi:hypothetical protein
MPWPTPKPHLRMVGRRAPGPRPRNVLDYKRQSDCSGFAVPYRHKSKPIPTNRRCLSASNRLGSPVLEYSPCPVSRACGHGSVASSPRAFAPRFRGGNDSGNGPGELTFLGVLSFSKCHLGPRPVFMDRLRKSLLALRESARLRRGALPAFVYFRLELGEFAQHRCALLRVGFVGEEADLDLQMIALV